MRQFIEFNGNEEGKVSLEVQCYALQEGEVEELIKLLEDKGFTFKNIQEDSLRARREGEYEEIYHLVGDLQGQGFYWSREAKEAEEQGIFATREELENSKV